MFSAEIPIIRLQEHILIVKVSTFIGWASNVLGNSPLLDEGGESTVSHGRRGKGTPTVSTLMVQISSKSKSGLRRLLTTDPISNLRELKMCRSRITATVGPSGVKP